MALTAFGFVKPPALGNWFNLLLNVK